MLGAHHLVCLHPIGEALRLDAAEIAVLKQTAQQTAGGCIDGDGARRRRGLQTRRQVRCLADHTAFLGFPGAYQIADHHHAGANANADLERLNAAQLANRLDERQSGPHRTLSVVLMRLRIAEIDEHAVAHVFRHEPAEAGDGLGDTFVISADHELRRSSGSSRVESALEPTRSVNITVTWRRSAVSCAKGVVVVVD